MIENFSAAIDDGELRAAKGKCVAGLYGNSTKLFFSEKFLVRVPASYGGGVFRVGIFAVVNERADRNAGRELRDAADVIAVVVRNQNVVDLGETGVFRGSDDAIRVTAVEAIPSGVNQQRFSGRRDEQSGLSALDVDKLNEQRFCRLRGEGELAAGAKQRAERRECDRNAARPAQ